MDAIIHTVGTLVQKQRVDLTYRAMNRDAAVNMARELNAFATADRKRNFVMLSSEKAPPFLAEYMTTKLEAE